MKVREVFTIRGGNQKLTSDFIYRNKPINKEDGIAVLSSSTNKSTFMGYISYKILKKENIKIFYRKNSFVVARNGKAGKIINISYEKFTANDHAYVFTLKKKYRHLFNEKWLAIELEPYFLEIVSRSQNGTFSKEVAGSIEIKPININFQNKIVELYEKLNITKLSLDQELEKIDSLLSKRFTYDNIDYVKVRDLFVTRKGITINEKDLYKNKGDIPVYSSQTLNDGKFGSCSREFYDKCRKKGKPNELTWTTNGNAGKVFYRKTEFLFTEKCGHLRLKNKFQGKMNLKYLQIVLNHETPKYLTSQEGNGKLEIQNMENVVIPIVPLSLQDKLADYYNKLERKKRIIEDRLIIIDKMISNKLFIDKFISDKKNQETLKDKMIK